MLMLVGLTGMRIGCHVTACGGMCEEQQIRFLR
jgi:hypothetical protein